MSRLKREPGSEIRHSSLSARATPRAASSDQPPCSRTATSPREPRPSSGPTRGAAGGRCSSEPVALFFSECFL